MKKLIHIFLIALLLGLPGCSKPEKKEGFGTIDPSQIPTAEDIKFKEPQEPPPEPELTEEQKRILAENAERKARQKVRNEELAKTVSEGQKRIQNKYKAKIEDRFKRLEEESSKKKELE